MKRENTVLRKLRSHVLLDGIWVTEIFFDLQHIRYGWNKEKKDYNAGPPRNLLSEEDILSFFERLNDDVNLLKLPSTNVTTKRFGAYVSNNDKTYKMIIDILEDETVVVVTIYRMKKNT